MHPFLDFFFPGLDCDVKDYIVQLSVNFRKGSYSRLFLVFRDRVVELRVYQFHTIR